MTSPPSRLASSAEMVRVLTQRRASLRASRIVLEPSRAMVRAKSSRWSATIAAVLKRIWARS